VAHFLLYTGGGLLVLSIVAVVLVATVVWYAVNAAVTVVAWACWRVYENARPGPARTYSPGRKA
jgi:hypothetical protein